MSISWWKIGVPLTALYFWVKFGYFILWFSPQDSLSKLTLMHSTDIFLYSAPTIVPLAPLTRPSIVLTLNTIAHHASILKLKTSSSLEPSILPSILTFGLRAVFGYLLMDSTDINSEGNEFTIFVLCSSTSTFV